MKLFTRSVLSSLFLSLALGLSACGQNNPNEQSPECGNGTIEDGEQCDDGDALSGDGCSSECELEEDECGDGTLSAGEQCDDGNNSNGDGCSSACTDESASQAEQINAYISSLGKLPTEENTGPTFGSPSAPSKDPSNDDYQCVTQELTQIQNDVEISSFSANSGNLFPGAIIRGDSLYNSTIDATGTPLKPVQFSVSLQNLNGGSDGEMQNPNIVEFRNKRNAILAAGVNGDVVVSSEPEIIQVNSKEELSIALGVDVKKANIAVGADFNFESSEERSHFIVRVRQILYTVDTVLPPKPSDLLGAGTTVEEVQALFNDENPAMYVQQLTYGRLLYFTFDSSVSSKELKAALDFKLSGATQIDANAALDFNQILSQTTLKGYIIGGSASSDLSELLGNSIDSIKTIIQENTLFPADDFDNFGDIIGFKLGYLSDNSTAALSFGGTTTIRECLRARQKVDVELMGIEAIADGPEAGNELEIYGSISAKGSSPLLTNNTVSLFSRSESSPVGITLGSAFGLNSTEINAGSDALDTKLVVVDVLNNGDLTLKVNLDEKDFGNADEPLENTKTLTVSQGFRGVKTVNVNNNGTEAKVNFRLTPVF